MTKEGLLITSPAVLRSTEAQLFVSDLAASSAFYVNQLGFGVAFCYGDPPVYGQVYRDEARLNLRVVGAPVFSGDIQAREHLLSATLTLATAEELRRLFQEYRAREVSFQRELQQEPWGAITFVVRDPDGNLILFAGPAA